MDRRISLWDIGLVVLGILLLKYLLLGPIYLVAMPFALLIEIFSDVDFPWGNALSTVFVFGLYMSVILWRRYPDKVPLWAKDIVGRALAGTEAGIMDDHSRPPEGGPRPGTPPPPSSRAALVRWEGTAASNEALEQLMGDLLSYEPESQGWLGSMAASLREQAQAGRLQGKMERVVAILEEEKKRMQALVEINKLSGQLQQSGLARDIEEKRIALERLKLEHDAQRAALEMREMLGLKLKEQALREKQIELEMARVERDLVDLRRQPEAPPAPRELEAPEVYASRRADLLIKYAGEVKRIRESIEDHDLAEDLVDRFLIDIMQREERSR